VQLVLIGQGEEGVSAAHDRLAATVSTAVASQDTAAATAGSEAAAAAVTDQIRAHDLFSLHEPQPADTDADAGDHLEQGGGEAAVLEDSGSVVFRLTGTERCGCQLGELRDRWHVDLNRLNAQLLAAVNSDAGPAFLSSVMLHQGEPVEGAAAGGRGKAELWLRHALGGRVSMATWWERSVAREAEAIVKRSAAMQAALGAGVACPKGEASLHMMEVGRRKQAEDEER
jgi:hypothetical protein